MVHKNFTLSLLQLYKHEPISVIFGPQCGISFLKLTVSPVVFDQNCLSAATEEIIVFNRSLVVCIS